MAAYEYSAMKFTGGVADMHDHGLLTFVDLFDFNRYFNGVYCLHPRTTSLIAGAFGKLTSAWLGCGWGVGGASGSIASAFSCCYLPLQESVHTQFKGRAFSKLMLNIIVMLRFYPPPPPHTIPASLSLRSFTNSLATLLCFQEVVTVLSIPKSMGHLQTKFLCLTS